MDDLPWQTYEISLRRVSVVSRADGKPPLGPRGKQEKQTQLRVKGRSE